MITTASIRVVSVTALAVLVVSTGFLVGRSAPETEAHIVGVTAGAGVPPHGGEPGTPPHAGEPGSPDHSAKPRTFGIAGDLAGLYPGFEGSLEVTLTNPNRFDIVVEAVEADVGASSDDGCSASNLTIADLDAPVIVLSQATATATLPAAMPHTAPDACQGVTFALTYTGSATKANQT